MHGTSNKTLANFVEVARTSSQAGRAWLKTTEFKSTTVGRLT
jgi:hypothetical protein